MVNWKDHKSTKPVITNNGSLKGFYQGFCYKKNEKWFMDNFDGCTEEDLLSGLLFARKRNGIA